MIPVETRNRMHSTQRRALRFLPSPCWMRGLFPITHCLLLLVPLLFRVLAWVPPRTRDGKIDKSWESVHAMRKRLRIDFNYTPSLLHPEVCRYLTEEECQHADESLRQHAASNVRRLRQQLWQHFSPHHQQQQLEEQQRDLQGGNIYHNPSVGKFKVLILMIRFSDHVNDRTLIEKSVIENLWNTEIKEWFQVNSYGAYEIEPVVIDWITTDNTEVYYANGISGFRPELQQAMWPALDELDNQPGWDWRQFDVDQDKQLDSVVMMHSGISAVISGEDCFGREPADRIRPHAFASSFGLSTWTSKDGSVSLNGYTVSSVFDELCDDKPLKTGLTIHEFMHTLNLIDLYDGEDLLGAKGVGGWDVMGHPYGADTRGRPGLLSAWSKLEADWLTPTIISSDGTYVARAAHDTPDAFRINIAPVGIPIQEYLLIENRQKIGFEDNLWGTGLLILHIDMLANEMKNRGYPGQPGWPVNGDHYQVAVLPKDGNYDLERNVNLGDAGDLFLPGDQLGPGMGNTVFPNTDSYQGGLITETGIVINVISQEGTDITFEVSGIKNEGQLPITTVPPPENGATPNSMTLSPTAAPVTATTIPPTALPSKESAVEGTEQPTLRPTRLPTMDLNQQSSPSDPIDEERWVLSRPPTPTRAPFDLPEFPVEEPFDEVVPVVINDSSASRSKNRWILVMHFGYFALLCFLM